RACSGAGRRGQPVRLRATRLPRDDRRRARSAQALPDSRRDRTGRCPAAGGDGRPGPPGRQEVVARHRDRRARTGPGPAARGHPVRLRAGGDRWWRVGHVRPDGPTHHQAPRRGDDVPASPRSGAGPARLAGRCRRSGPHRLGGPMSTPLQVVESATVLWPDRTVGPGRITVSGDRITAVEPLVRVPDGPAGPAVHRVAGLVAPGFVDTHGHPRGGGDCASTDREVVLRARDFHRSHGTTGIIASLVTDTLEQVLAELDLLRGLCDAGEFDGIHLETPFLSEAKCGAHPPALLRHPDPETVEKLIVAGGDRLSMITIAPELPGALDAIDRFVAAGVRVAVGHTAGTVDDAKAALDHGATVATHLFNAMNSIHHRTPG